MSFSGRCSLQLDAQGRLPLPRPLRPSGAAGGRRLHWLPHPPGGLLIPDAELDRHIEELRSQADGAWYDDPAWTDELEELLAPMTALQADTQFRLRLPDPELTQPGRRLELWGLGQAILIRPIDETAASSKGE